MWHRLAPEVRTIVAHAKDMARMAGHPLNSVHFLLALYVTPCAARATLKESGIDNERVLRTFKSLPRSSESPGVLSQVREQAQLLVDSSQAVEVDSTILLASLLRVRHGQASRVLRRAGVSLPQLRAQVIGQLTQGIDRASSTRLRAIQLGERQGLSSEAQPAFAPGGGGADACESPPPRRVPRERSPDLDMTDGALRRLVDSGHNDKAVDTPAPAAKSAPVATPAPVAMVTPPTIAPAADERAARVFQLEPDRFPTLCELGRDLTRAGLAGEITPLIGREGLVDAVIDVLLMRETNNPCLIGEAGVGKTAIAEGLAAKLAGRTDLYGHLGEAVIVELQVASLLAGTSFRGAFSERMSKLREEVASAEGRIIVFIDEIHTLMGAGAGEGPMDAANDLKTALARGRFPLIGATTRAEYRQHIEKDPAMERRLQLVEVPEPGPDEACAILSGVAPLYARHHGLPFSHEAVVSAVHLSKRFITDRCLPGKAIAVLDRAGAQAKRQGKKRVGSDDVARAVHTLTQVPMDRLLADERSRIRNLAADLGRWIVGQDDAMARIARRVQRNYAGFSGDKPLASFIFVGPPGTGKTATAAALAEALFMVEDALARFDMTEYTESHSAARLVGSPPGYVGHQQHGLLSQAMHKRPYRVLLFDDIDRAAPEVVALVQQILDSGRVVDNHGRQLDMRNSIVVLTTGQGADPLLAGSRQRPIGFGAPATVETPGDELEKAVFDRVRKELPAELWGRIDEPVLFHPLGEEAGHEIVRRQLQESAATLYRSRLIELLIDASVVELVLGEGGVDPSLGARPLRSRVEELVEGFLTEQVLNGELKSGSRMRVVVVRGQLALCSETADGELAAATQA